MTASPPTPAKAPRRPKPGEADKKTQSKPRVGIVPAAPKKRRKRYNRIDDISRNDVMAVIRDLYAADSEPCDRETLLGLLRDELGLGALGTRIRKELSGDIRAAVRRGILERTAGQYALLCQHIGQHDPNFLREQFLASLGSRDRNPHAWIGREAAMREAARFLGFRRTGQTIQKAFRSAINSALRRGELEKYGSAIRRAR